MTELKGEAWIHHSLRRQRDLAIVIATLPVTTSLVATGLGLSRLVDGRNPLFDQERIGKHGMPFIIHKVRTMHSNNSVPSGGALDERATRLGRFLRVSAIDELPQILNILAGDLSVVGPRAVVAAEIQDMAQVLPRTLFAQWEDVYLSDGPGCVSTNGILTHAQPRDLEASYLQRAPLDIADSKNASPAHDLQLIARLGAMASRVAKGYLL